MHTFQQASHMETITRAQITSNSGLLKRWDFALGRREATHNIFLNENDAEKEGDMVFQAES